MFCCSDKYTIMEKKSGYKLVMLLTIQNVTKADIGTYTCIAQNTMGKSEDSARLYGKLEFKKSSFNMTPTKNAIDV